VNEFSLLYESKVEILDRNHPRTAVVLGGFAEYDGGRKRVQMAMAAERMFEAYRLYKNHTLDTLIISGGAASLTSNQKPESQYIRKYLIDLGMDSTVILIDTGSKNTFENAVQTKKILVRQNHKAPVLLITSAMHMPRAKRVFSKVGILAQPYPVNFLSDLGRGYVIGDYLMPSSEALYHFDALIKEWVGLIVYKLTGKA